MKEFLENVRLKVRFHDCDPLGIVWHGNYFKYFEEAREIFSKKYGFSYLDARNNGYSTPIVQTETSHQSPLKYGDEFNVSVKFIPVKAAKIVFEYEITHESKLVCTAKTVQVFLDENKELVLINPAFYVKSKEKMGVGK